MIADVQRLSNEAFGVHDVNYNAHGKSCHRVPEQLVVVFHISRGRRRLRPVVVHADEVDEGVVVEIHIFEPEGER